MDMLLEDYMINEICTTGKLSELQKYYYDNPDISIHTKNELAFRLSCRYGQIDMAKWLIRISHDKKIGLINIHAKNDDAFFWSGVRGHLEVVKWLIELSRDDKFGLINIHEYDDDVFVHNCINGNLELAKWLMNLSYEEKMVPFNIHKNNEYLFWQSCINGHLEVARWLYFLDRSKFDVTSINEIYHLIKKDKLLIRTIGGDYKSNNLLGKEFRKEYNKWKLVISIRVLGKIIKFYKYILEKTYLPNGVGYKRTKDHFDNMICAETNKLNIN